jgi:hypothetical protein
MTAHAIVSGEPFEVIVLRFAGANPRYLRFFLKYS